MRNPADCLRKQGRKRDKVNDREKRERRRERERKVEGEIYRERERCNGYIEREWKGEA